MKTTALPAALALALWLTGCLKSTVEPLDFFVVKTGLETSPDQPASITFMGAVDSLDRSSVEACGFIYSLGEDWVSDPSGGGFERVEAAPPVGEGGFAHVFGGLQQGQRVFFRAWARTGDREVFAPAFPVRSYELGDLVYIDGVKWRKNDAAIITGGTIGLEAVNAEATGYGFVYSPTDPLPELGKPGCLATDLAPEKGATGDDKPFEDTLTGLLFNKTYRIRAYVVVGGQAFYSPGILSLKTRDGWKRLGKLPVSPMTGASFAAVEGLGAAFGGFFCDNPGVCENDELPRDFFEIRPSGDSAVFEKRADFPPFGTAVARTRASVFEVGGTLYAFFGQADDTFAAAGCWKIDLPGSNWQPVSFANAQPPNRAGAATFTIDSKAYFVSGLVHKPPSGNLAETNETWQFDPSTGLWAAMAPLPMYQYWTGKEVDDTGRREAVSFAIGGLGYVGGGMIDGRPLKDFWRFTPPTAAEPKGRWDRMADIPAEAKGRTEATSFAVGGHGYFCTGRHPTDGYTNDLWRFDPSPPTGQWAEREPFPGQPRTLAFGFGLGGFGFVGGGDRLGAGAAAMSDLWRYEPEQ